MDVAMETNIFLNTRWVAGDEAGNTARCWVAIDDTYKSVTTDHRADEKYGVNLIYNEFLVTSGYKAPANDLVTLLPQHGETQNSIWTQSDLLLQWRNFLRNFYCSGELLLFMLYLWMNRASPWTRHFWILTFMLYSNPRRLNYGRTVLYS